MAMQSNGDFTYQPPANFTGTLRLAVQATDSHESIGTLDLQIIVTPVNDGPSAHADSFKAPPGRPTDVPVLANDIDVTTTVANGAQPYHIMP